MGRAEAALAVLFCGFLAGSASADDAAPSTWGTAKSEPPAVEAAPESGQTGAAGCDCRDTTEAAAFERTVAEFADRVVRARSLEADREGAAFDDVERRYEKLAKFRTELDERDEAAFDAKVSENVKLIQFTKRLEAAREEEQWKAFEDGLERALRIRAFLTRLVERARNAHPHVPPPLADEPEQWDAPK